MLMQQCSITEQEREEREREKKHNSEKINEQLKLLLQQEKDREG